MTALHISPGFNLVFQKQSLQLCSWTFFPSSFFLSEITLLVEILWLVLYGWWFVFFSPFYPSNILFLKCSNLTSFWFLTHGCFEDSHGWLSSFLLITAELNLISKVIWSIYPVGMVASLCSYTIHLSELKLMILLAPFVWRLAITISRIWVKFAVSA